MIYSQSREEKGRPIIRQSLKWCHSLPEPQCLPEPLWPGLRASELMSFGQGKITQAEGAGATALMNGKQRAPIRIPHIGLESYNCEQHDKTRDKIRKVLHSPFPCLTPASLPPVKGSVTLWASGLALVVGIQHSSACWSLGGDPRRSSKVKTAGNLPKAYQTHGIYFIHLTYLSSGPLGSIHSISTTKSITLYLLRKILEDCFGFT